MLCFRKRLVAKKFMEKKWEGDYLKFPSKYFCLTVPKHFVEEPFYAVFQKSSVGENVYGRELGRGSIDVFRRKFLVSKCRKVSNGNLLVCL